MGIVVTYINGVAADACLQSIKRQTVKPATVVVVHRGGADRINRGTEDHRWKMIHVSSCEPANARNAGLACMLELQPQPLSVAFLDGDDELTPDFVARCSDVLERCPQVGIVSFWTEEWGATKRVSVQASPAFPYQWMRNDAATASALRTDAVTSAGCFRPMESPEYERWDLITAIMAGGWRAVTVPAVLHRRHIPSVPTYTNTRMLTKIYERFPDLLAQDVVDVARLSRSGISGMLSGRAITPREQVDLVRVLLRSPGRTARWAVRALRKRVSRRAWSKA